MFFVSYSPVSVAEGGSAVLHTVIVGLRLRCSAVCKHDAQGIMVFNIQLRNGKQGRVWEIAKDV